MEMKCELLDIVEGLFEWFGEAGRQGISEGNCIISVLTAWAFSAKFFGLD